MSKSKHDLEDGEIVSEKRGKNDEPPVKKSKTEQKTSFTGKTGGAYIPPARLRMMQKMITDKSSAEYQRISWEALKKSINGLINKVNVSNISSIVRELFQENIVRGRGILAQSILQAQNASPTFTQVYAALVSIINTRFPQNGELILRRLAIQFRRSYKRNRKDVCLHSSQFIAHLINQQVAHEIIGLQILTLLLETPSDDSVEVAIGFLKECGQKLMDVSPRGLAAVMQRLRTILHEQELDKRVQYMIEVMFAIRKDGFKEHPAVTEELDLVEESDQFTHMLQLEDDGAGKGTENELNVFHVDEDFVQNEENYKQIKKDILDESSEGSSGSSGDSSSDSSEDEAAEEAKTQEIEDLTETNLVALRRTIYLAIQSSLDFEECAHKLLKMEFDVKDYKEICAMIIDCCSQQRTYEKFYGLLGARFCILKKEFMENFEILFAEQYGVIHRLETNKLRNVAKLFAHFLHSDALPWTVLSNIRLSEDSTTSSSRIFIKILFQELVEYLGLQKLNLRLKDETLAPFFEGLFPRDNPKDTRFAINFFTSIGLGGVTDELREHLKDAARAMTEKLQAEQLASLNMDSTNSDDESSSDEKSKKNKRKKSSKTKKKASKKSKSKKKKKSKSSSKSEDSEELKKQREWESESDSSSPERKMKSSVVIKSQTGSSKNEKPDDESKGSIKAKENGAKEKSKSISKKKKKRHTPSSSSSEASSSSISSVDQAQKKKSGTLKERLLKISNTTFSKESTTDRKRAEIPVVLKVNKKSSVRAKRNKRSSSSSESSSESSESDSDSDSSDEVETVKKSGKNMKPRKRDSSNEKHDKGKRNGARHRKNSSDGALIQEKDKTRKNEVRSRRTIDEDSDRYENKRRESRVDDYENRKERSSHHHRRRSRSLGR